MVLCDSSYDHVLLAFEALLREVLTYDVGLNLKVCSSGVFHPNFLFFNFFLLLVLQILSLSLLFFTLIIIKTQKSNQKTIHPNTS